MKQGMILLSGPLGPRHRWLLRGGTAYVRGLLGPWGERVLALEPFSSLDSTSAHATNTPALAKPLCVHIGRQQLLDGLPRRLGPMCRRVVLGVGLEHRQRHRRDDTSD